jgi:hypothetical protein
MSMIMFVEMIWKQKWRYCRLLELNILHILINCVYFENGVKPKFIFFDQHSKISEFQHFSLIHVNNSW